MKKILATLLLSAVSLSLGYAENCGSDRCKAKNCAECCGENCKECCGDNCKDCKKCQD